VNSSLGCEVDANCILLGYFLPTFRANLISSILKGQNGSDCSSQCENNFHAHKKVPHIQVLVTINYLAFLGLDNPFSITQIHILLFSSFQIISLLTAHAESIRLLGTRLQFCEMFVYSFVHRVFWEVRVQFGTQRTYGIFVQFSTQRFLWNVGVQFGEHMVFWDVCLQFCTQGLLGC